MNKITTSPLVLAASLALVGCIDSSTAPRSSGTSSNVVLTSYMNPTIKYGSFIDARDSQTYATVVIGTQTWMAQNLNYKPTTAPDSSWCYNDSASYCVTYGRLYDYTTALTVCPIDWHLPDTTEWNTLEVAAGGSATAGTKLKSATGWNVASGYIAGTNAYGFSILPKGFYRGYDFAYVGVEGVWWTATARGRSNAWDIGTDYNWTNLSQDDFSLQTFGFSVRCLKNTP